ncbi:dual OB domain-containing protein [Burkholderia pseudomallei]|uniref:dual OB domain-containing protein n=1 Tax=Burkholderia pseudomallei TaxID=28450 RepID=UPI0011C4E5BA|nr:hypothetical protein [Burkholderia pseudomallei]
MTLFIDNHIDAYPDTRRSMVDLHLVTHQIMVVYPDKKNSYGGSMTTKRIICFANSQKGAGHCVAGLELFPNNTVGGWIRPIGTGYEEALLHSEQAYADGTSPRLLDILDVHLVEPRPQGCQTENWFVDSTQRWSKFGQYRPADVAALAASPPTLFENMGHTSAGMNDQIPNATADARAGSLLLVHVPRLEIHVIQGYHVGETKVQARFDYRGVDYWLTVTDPAVKREFQPHGIGAHDLGSCLACISLAMPFVKSSDQIAYRFKLVAGVIRLS